MMQNVVQAFNDYPSDKLEDMWASYYNNMRSIMKELGGNDYKQAHKVAKRDSEEQNQEIAELCKGGREEVNKLQ